MNNSVELPIITLNSKAYHAFHKLFMVSVYLLAISILFDDVRGSVPYWLGIVAGSIPSLALGILVYQEVNCRKIGVVVIGKEKLKVEFDGTPNQREYDLREHGFTFTDFRVSERKLWQSWIYSFFEYKGYNRIESADGACILNVLVDDGDKRKLIYRALDFKGL